MKKIKLFLLLIVIVSSVYSQSEQKENTKTCLFGFIADTPEEFNDVISYLRTLDIKIIDTCNEEFLIYIELPRLYKDYMQLFNKIEKNFKGKCYYKSETNDLIKYAKCKDEYIKKNNLNTAE